MEAKYRISRRVNRSIAEMEASEATLLLPGDTLKVELVHQCRWATHAEARQALFGYIEGYYNRHRMHSALGYLTPDQAEQSMTG